MTEKRFILIENKSDFTSTLQTQYSESLVFIQSTEELWTHGHYYSLDKTSKANLAALKCFSQISDGTTTAVSPSSSGTITFSDEGNVKITVSAAGVTIKGMDVTASDSSADKGTIKVVNADGTVEHIAVYGLASAAFYDSEYFATTSSVTDAATAASNAQTAINNHIADTDNPHEVDKADVGLGNVENYSRAQILADAALTGNPTAPTPASTDNDTSVATTAFVQTVVDGAIGATNALRFKGIVGGTDNSTAADMNPHEVGDVWIAGVAGTYVGVDCEAGDMIICIEAGTAADNSDWRVVQANIEGAVTAVNTLTANCVVLGNGNKAVKVLANGSNGLFLKIVNGVPTWASDNNTTYSFVNGSNGSFTVNGQVVSIGKPATAGTADEAKKVENALTLTLGTSTPVVYDGDVAKSVTITPSAIGAAPTSHMHTGTQVTMKGYSKPTISDPATAADIAATDTVNAAMGKVEAKLNKLIDQLEWVYIS